MPMAGQVTDGFTNTLVDIRNHAGDALYVTVHNDNRFLLREIPDVVIVHSRTGKNQPVNTGQHALGGSKLLIGRLR